MTAHLPAFGQAMNIDDAFAVRRVSSLSPRASAGAPHPQNRVRLNADGTVMLTLPTLEVRDTGVAVLTVEGALMQQPEFFEEVYGGCTEDAKVIALLRQARDNAAVKVVALRLSSPGGTSMGESDLVGAIAALDRVKPVYALVNDLATSKAYKLASACRAIVSTSSAIVGSIATALHIVDDSGMIEKLGGSVHTIVSGKKKFIGKMTPEKLDAAQQMVDAIGEGFAQYVAERRGLPVETVLGWEGATFTAEEGVKLGLIDRIVEPDEFIAELDKQAVNGAIQPVSGSGGRAAQRVEGSTQNLSQGVPAMSTHASGRANISNQTNASAATDPQAAETDASANAAADAAQTTDEAKKNESAEASSMTARVTALQAAFPEDAAMVVEALKNNWDVPTAKAAAYDRIKSKSDTTPTNPTASSKARAPQTAAGSAAPLVTQSAAPMVVAASEQHVANAIAGIKADKAGYTQAVDAAMKAGQLNRGQAVATVNRLRPDLRKAYAA